MLTSDVISKFETYVDDATELSSQQELDLVQKIFNKVWTAKPWEFAKSSASGSYALTTPNIPIPQDFSNFLENDQASDNTREVNNNASPKVVFIGSNYQPFQVVNWSARRKYRNRTGFLYLDLPNDAISFTCLPVAIDTYEFDYKTTAPTLVLDDEIPGIPSDFHDMLYHGMAVDDEIILRFPRANAYAPDNQAQYNAYFAALAQWNASLQND